MAEPFRPEPGRPAVQMMPVDADSFESVGYTISSRKLFVKFRNAPMTCFEDVPGFRFQGLLSAPSKDAYFRTYIKSQFLAKELPPPST